MMGKTRQKRTANVQNSCKIFQKYIKDRKKCSVRCKRSVKVTLDEENTGFRVEIVHFWERIQQSEDQSKEEPLKEVNTIKSYIGRRTGKLIEIKQHKDKDGFNFIEDCFPIVDEEEENISLKEPENPVVKDVGPRMYYGRRTGTIITINHKKDKHGFDCIADYFPDKQNESTCSLQLSSGKNIDKSLPDISETKEDGTTDVITPNEQPDKESPNLTGTAVKNKADANDSAVEFYGSKKRLFASCEETIGSPVDIVDTPRNKTEGDVDITGISSDEEDIDVENHQETTNNKNTGISSDEEDIDVENHQETTNNNNTGISSDEEDIDVENHQETTNNNNTGISSDEEDIDVENHQETTNNNNTGINSMPNEIKLAKEQDDSFINDIENDDSTFVTLGLNKTKSSRAADVSEVDVEGISFEINESVVLDGTKHKPISPEFGAPITVQPDDGAPEDDKSKGMRGKKKSVAQKERMTKKEKENDYDISEQNSRKRSSTRRSTKTHPDDATSEQNTSQAVGDAHDESVFKAPKGRASRKSTRGSKGISSSDISIDKSIGVEQDMHQASHKTDLDENSVLIPKAKASRKSVRGAKSSGVAIDTEQELSTQETSTVAPKSKASRKSVRGAKSSGVAIDTEQELSRASLNRDTQETSTVAPKSKASRKSVREAKSSSVTIDKHLDVEQELSRASPNHDTEASPVATKPKASRKSSRGVQSSSATTDSQHELSQASPNRDTDTSTTAPKSKASRKSTKRAKSDISVDKFPPTVPRAEQSLEKSEEPELNDNSLKPKSKRKSTRSKHKESINVTSEKLEHTTVDRKRERKSTGRQSAKASEVDSQTSRKVDGEYGMELTPEDWSDTSGYSLDTTKRSTSTEVGHDSDDDNDDDDDGGGDNIDYDDDDNGDVAGDMVGDGDDDNDGGGDDIDYDDDDNGGVAGVRIDDGDDDGGGDDIDYDDDDNGGVAGVTVDDGDGDNVDLVEERPGDDVDDIAVDDDDTGEDGDDKENTENLKKVDKEQYKRKSRGRPKKSTNSVIETSSHDAAQNDVMMMPDDDISDHTHGVHHSPDNTVSNSNDYEADASQTKTSSDSSIKNSSSASKDEKKTRKRKQKKTRIIPRELIRHKNQAQQSKKASNETSSEGETSESEGKKLKRTRKTNSTKQDVSPEKTGNDTSVKNDNSKTGVKSQTKKESSVNSIPPESCIPVMLNTPFNHPKGSLIKSILKSSLPRSLASDSKKQSVSISSKKNQMQSHDADDDDDVDDDVDDDDDVASRSNRQRQSSVSFAPTPSFRITPDDFTSPEDTPEGYPDLSFVANWSSLSSGDKTFTPGNSFASSTMTSIASNSIPDTSTLNDSQEVTISSAKKRQIEEEGDEGDNLRRSKRTKVPPLKYWKNERIKYKRRQSGWYVDGIESVPTPKTQRKKRNTNRKRVPVSRKNVYDGYGGNEPQSFDGVPEDMEVVTCEPVSVINPYDGEEVKLDLLHLPEMLQFVNASQTSGNADDALLIDKYISHNLFGIGQLILRPGAEKGMQHVRQDTMVFHVLAGQVEVTIHQTTSHLPAGATFFVPEGNCYNLKNTHTTDTRLFFVQIKADKR